jgi:hypothetical protein
MSALVKDHWFRNSEQSVDHCVYALDGTPCAQLAEHHVEVVGEWMQDANHLFVPSPLSFRCVRCKRAWAHSWHYGSAKHRQIYDWRNWFFRLRDRVVGPERLCWHLSHRIKMPCWRSMYSTCSGLCEKHYNACHEECR